MKNDTPPATSRGRPKTGLLLCLLVALSGTRGCAAERWEWAWAWPENGAVHQQGAWRQVESTRRPFDQARVGPLCCLADGSLLVGIQAEMPGFGREGSLWQLSDGSFQLLWPFSGPGAPVPTCLLERPAGRIWVGSTDGLWICHAGKWTGLAGYRASRQIASQSVPDMPARFGAIASLAAESDSTIWVTTEEGYLVRIDCPVEAHPGRWITHDSALLRGGDPIEMQCTSFARVATGARGSVWAVRRDGTLCRRENGSTWTVIDALLPISEDERIGAFYIDRQGSPWIATVHKRGGRVFSCVGRTWTLDESLGAKAHPFRVVGFGEDPKGRLVAVTSGVGLLVREGTQWGPHPANADCPHILARQPSSEQKDVLRRTHGIDEVQWASRSETRPAVCWGADGSLWVGGRGQLWRLRERQ